MTKTRKTKRHDLEIRFRTRRAARKEGDALATTKQNARPFRKGSKKKISNKCNAAGTRRV